MSGVLVLSTTFVLLVSFMLFAASETGVLREEIISAGFHNPKFFGERGVSGYDLPAGSGGPTSNYVTFEMLRRGVFAAGAAAVLGYALVTAWAEACGLAPRGSAKSVFAKFLGVLVLVAAFVPVWDLAAVQSERFGVMMLNPLYSMEPYAGPDGAARNDRCIPGAYEEPGPRDGAGRRGPSDRDGRPEWRAAGGADPLLAMLAAQNAEMSRRVDGGVSPCDPRLRISYVYDRAFWGATDGLEDAGAGLDRAFGMLEDLASRVGSGVFMGMTKVMLLFSVTLLGLIVMTARELFLALVISMLPLFALLTFVPKAGAAFSRLLESVVPLLLVPAMTAAVFFTGAGILMDMEDGAGGAGGLFTFWVAAVSLLMLATGMPLMIAPVLSGLVGQASSAVGAAVLSGAGGAMSVAEGAGRGALAGYRSGGLRGGLAGLGGGAGAGAGAGMMQDVAVGLGTVRGAGGLGSPFARGAGAVMSMSGRPPAPGGGAAAPAPAASGTVPVLPGGGPGGAAAVPGGGGEGGGSLAAGLPPMGEDPAPGGGRGAPLGDGTYQTDEEDRRAEKARDARRAARRRGHRSPVKPG